MLRWGLLVVGLVLIGVGLAYSWVSGTLSGLQFLIWGAVLVFAVLCERWRYRRREQHTKKGMWQRTGECFEDPETGLIMEVLYDPVSGERRYETRGEHSSPSEKE